MMVDNRGVIVFLGPKYDANCMRALEFLQRHTRVVYELQQGDEPFPASRFEHLDQFTLISFRSGWHIPEDFLIRAYLRINFHPGPPEYPGFGAINFALYEGVMSFGVTCHLMTPQICDGPIFDARRFPIFPHDDIGSLTQRTHDVQLAQFYDMVGRLMRERILPNPKSSGHAWTRPPFTRAQLHALGKIDPGMTYEEIERRKRATMHGNFKPELTLSGHRFQLMG